MTVADFPAELVPPPTAAPEREKPTPRAYDCADCRFADSHGLICDVCIRKILDERVTWHPKQDRNPRREALSESKKQNITQSP
jgi:hypothetical protein